ncbi:MULTISPECIES: helix-turn-helix domain-containing protein [unclassified Lysinibacillus]|uniref:helix-turn-helix transcriptional regulator n=1 Tax=unclassified Lysinibacillus TaxID=2636778 RepID=UPI00087ED293|nr:MULTISPECIES: helix-turn-helix domain-containing protein [unclassified Lysinibacillus]SCY87250.1 transcriptional regulator, AlpA family [Lysinibacillus sp. SG9]SDB38375.1 transcriptional regulator, AlpA family [Lysinibacillus sp. TC-37]SFT02404.1 transcriptional regulator, AlpA family [Lysinibacillus sp. SG55]
MEIEYLTVRSLSKLLDVSEQTIYKLANEGLIPGRVKVGKIVRFKKEDVMDWLQNGGSTNEKSC